MSGDWRDHLRSISLWPDDAHNLGLPKMDAMLGIAYGIEIGERFVVNEIGKPESGVCCYEVAAIKRKNRRKDTALVHLVRVDGLA